MRFRRSEGVFCEVLKKLIKYWIVKNNPPNQINKISISGTIGLTILRNSSLNKLVYLFFDDHSSKEYCNNSSNKGNKIYVNEIYKFFENKYQNPIFLLEEPFILENEKLLGLWNDSIHLEKLKDFYSNSITFLITRRGFSV